MIAADNDNRFFRGQVVHLLLLSIFLVGTCLLVDFKQLAERRVLGVGAHVWLIVSLGVPIVHQVYVWLAWRSELCFGAVTGWLGSRAFVIYQIVFFILFLARPVSLTLLTIADHDSFEMSIPVRVVICVILGFRLHTRSTLSSATSASLGQQESITSTRATAASRS